MLEISEKKLEESLACAKEIADDTFFHLSLFMLLSKTTTFKLCPKKIIYIFFVFLLFERTMMRAERFITMVIQFTLALIVFLIVDFQ